jgi:putative acetyltransferase
MSSSASATTTQLCIEPIDPRHAEVAPLVRDLTAELFERYDGEDDGTGNFRPEDVLVPGAGFFVGRVGGVAVACGAFKPLSPGIAELKRFFVAPAHRGRGYGALLLAELERRAAAAGYHTIRLETGTRQPESIRLYERAGYRQIPNFDPHVHSVWSVCYEKSLGPVP